MSQQPRTSIIMPVYNTAATVVRAIKSVQAQTDPDWELLVVIDASPDNSFAVIQEYLRLHPDSRIRVFNNQENRKQAGARNYGIERARGAWLAFLDSDDTFVPEALDIMHHAAAAGGAQIVAAAHNLIQLDGSVRKRNRATAAVVQGRQALELLLKDRCSAYTWDKLYRRDVCESVFFQDIQRAEDLLWNVEVLPRAGTVALIDEIVYEYHVNANSLTWSDLTAVTESKRLIKMVAQAVQRQPQHEVFHPAFLVQETLIYLNTAHQAIVSKHAAAGQVLRECRSSLKLKNIAVVLRLRPDFGIAALLFKLFPRLYAFLYRSYVAKQYSVRSISEQVEQ